MDIDNNINIRCQYNINIYYSLLAQFYFIFILFIISIVFFIFILFIISIVFSFFCKWY